MSNLDLGCFASKKSVLVLSPKLSYNLFYFKRQKLTSKEESNRGG
jgi:hypothetical protein